MPKVNANGITINYERQGSGEPLVLIPYLAADHACYAFQVADYAKHFTCFSLDLRGTGASDKPDVYSFGMVSAVVGLVALLLALIALLLAFALPSTHAKQQKQQHQQINFSAASTG